MRDMGVCRLHLVPSLSSFPEPCAADLPLESLPSEPPGLAPADQKEPPSPQQVEEARVREVPVTAVILAAKSTFFMKLFTTGMRETVDKRVVTVHLTAKGGLPSLSLSLRYSRVLIPFRIYLFVQRSLL